MANVYAVKSGNWSDPTVWNTGTLPTSADDVYANGASITINISVSVLSIRNSSASGISAGGIFNITSGVTLTASVLVTGGTEGNWLLDSAVVSPGSASIIMTTISYATQFNRKGIYHRGTGTLNITGNCPSGTGGNQAVNNTSSGTINIYGNVTGGTSNDAAGVRNTLGGTINIYGNVTGSSSANTDSPGVYNFSVGSVNITGNVVCNGGGYSAVLNISSGSVNITGNATAGTSYAAVSNTSSGALTHIGTATANNNVPAITSSSTSTFFSGPFICSANGTHAVLSSWWRWIPTPIATYYQIRSANLSVIRPLYTADSVGGNPSVSNVRSGTTFGPSNELTGTAAIPPVQSVTYGVAVGNTTGTAALNVADIWNYPVSGITTSGSIGERLKTAATVNVMGQLISDSFSAK